ncbi:hypothetical protein JCM5296_002187 [Sporobolomyces johnsonii]
MTSTPSTARPAASTEASKMPALPTTRTTTSPDVSKSKRPAPATPTQADPAKATDASRTSPSREEALNSLHIRKERPLQAPAPPTSASMRPTTISTVKGTPPPPPPPRVAPASTTAQPEENPEEGPSPSKRARPSVSCLAIYH